jgi:hypothetical protein
MDVDLGVVVCKLTVGQKTGANITIADNGYMRITGSVNMIVFLFLRNPMTTLKNFNHFTEC